MSRTIINPTTNARGDESHPQYATVIVTRGHGTPRPLFCSDIKQTNTITLRVNTATRNRNLGRDWVHPENQIVEVEMSLAQWAAVVSSIGEGSGTPVTLRWTREDGAIPDAPYQPRVQKSYEEVTGAVGKLLAEAEEALAQLNEVEENKGGVNARREARARLQAALGNARSNAAFAVRSMTAAAETVVSHAKADIETAIVQARSYDNPVALEALSDMPALDQ